MHTMRLVISCSSPSVLPIFGHVRLFRTLRLYTEHVGTTTALLSLSRALYSPCHRPPGQPEHKPWPHPQQLKTPMPQLRRMRARTLTRPSPSTKPLAITINVMSLPLPLGPRRALHPASIAPPISLANVNDGVFKKPMENATPEGMYFVNLDCPCAQYTFAAATRPNMIEKMIMKNPLLSGRFPSPISWSKYCGWVISRNPHGVNGRGLTRCMQSVPGRKAPVSRTP